MQFPLRLHFFDIVNVPIPFVVGFNSLLNDNVCPVLIVSVSTPTAKLFQLPSPSTQYSHALIDNFAVNPSSSASIVR